MQKLGYPTIYVNLGDLSVMFHVLQIEVALIVVVLWIGKIISNWLSSVHQYTSTTFCHAYVDVMIYCATIDCSMKNRRYR